VFLLDEKHKITHELGIGAVLVGLGLLGLGLLVRMLRLGSITHIHSAIIGSSIVFFFFVFFIASFNFHVR